MLFRKYDRIEIFDDSIDFLLIGKIKKNIKTFYLKKQTSNFYNVQKPWGSEIWINSINNEFAFKKIFIKKGFQTSLQFHKYKRETMIISDGEAGFYYKKNNKINNINVSHNDIGKKKIKSNYVISVKPKKIHRIKALQNILIYEVSSPHLTDVVRIKDDTNRKSGHISYEHQKKN